MRSDSVLIDGYVNAVGRDSRPILNKGGERFIEQIVPGAFTRALDRNNDVQLLLNHDPNRVLGSTKDVLQLYEDSIGLRAVCEVTDPEVVQKAKEKKLRGWSFGFKERASTEEETPKGMKRRFVEELDLKEISIIDERKVPCYAGTSIQTRADGEEVTETRAEETKAIYADVSEPALDYSGYKNRINSFKK